MIIIGRHPLFGPLSTYASPRCCIAKRAMMSWWGHVTDYKLPSLTGNVIHPHVDLTPMWTTDLTPDACIIELLESVLINRSHLQLINEPDTQGILESYVRASCTSCTSVALAA
jgi:hypothetical protein